MSNYKLNSHIFYVIFVSFLRLLTNCTNIGLKINKRYVIDVVSTHYNCICKVIQIGTHLESNQYIVYSFRIKNNRAECLTYNNVENCKKQSTPCSQELKACVYVWIRAVCKRACLRFQKSHFFALCTWMQVQL